MTTARRLASNVHFVSGSQSVRTASGERESAMTPIAGFIIAVIAGLAIRRGRRAALVVVVPWLIVLVYQSWYIASGRAISPPSTVTDFPSAIGYWVVQAIIVAPALGIAAQLGGFGSRRRTVDPGDLARRSWIAAGLGVAVSVIVILYGFVWFRQQGGTVYAGHHSSDGSPPLIGILGILLSYLTCAGLGVATIRARHAARRAAAGQSAQQYEMS
jgi:hypothetical protein